MLCAYSSEIQLILSIFHFWPIEWMKLLWISIFNERRTKMFSKSIQSVLNNFLLIFLFSDRNKKRSKAMRHRKQIENILQNDGKSKIEWQNVFFFYIAMGSMGWQSLIFVLNVLQKKWRKNCVKCYEVNVLWIFFLLLLLRSNFIASTATTFVLVFYSSFALFNQHQTFSIVFILHWELKFIMVFQLTR